MGITPPQCEGELILFVLSEIVDHNNRIVWHLHPIIRQRLVTSHNLDIYVHHRSPDLIGHWKIKMDSQMLSQWNLTINLYELFDKSDLILSWICGLQASKVRERIFEADSWLSWKRTSSIVSFGLNYFTLTISWTLNAG